MAAVIQAAARVAIGGPGGPSFPAARPPLQPSFSRATYALFFPVRLALQIRFVGRGGAAAAARETRSRQLVTPPSALLLLSHGYKRRLGSLLEKPNRLPEVRTWEDNPMIKRHYDYTRKVIQVELAMLLAFQANCAASAANHALLYKISMSLLGLAFLIDVLSMVGLISWTNFSGKWSRACIYISNFCQILVAYFLLSSSNKLNACAILAVLLPPAVAYIQHWACNSGRRGASLGNGAAGNLEHIFDLASVVYSINAAGGLIGVIWGGAMRSKEPAAEDLVGLFLYLPIVLAQDLMVITTLRPPVLTRHADLFHYIMGPLLVASPLIATAEFVGWGPAVVVLAVGAADAAFSYWLVMIRGPVSSEEDDASPTRSHKLLSAHCTAILFGLVIHLYSQNAPVAGEVGHGIGFLDKARMLFYFHALMWSCSRMLLPPVEVAGGAVWVRVWSAFKLLRGSAVGLVVVEVAYRMGMYIVRSL